MNIINTDAYEQFENIIFLDPPYNRQQQIIIAKALKDMLNFVMEKYDIPEEYLK